MGLSTNGENTLRLSISGMHCASCVAEIERRFKNVSGVINASVNLLSNSAVVQYVYPKTNPETIINSLDGSQFTARPVMDEASIFLNRGAIKKKKELYVGRFILSVFLSAIVVAICMIPGLHHTVGQAILGAVYPVLYAILAGNVIGANFMGNMLLLLLTTPVQLFCAWPFLKGAVGSVRSKNLNMDFLVAFGTIIAYIVSLYITFEPFFISQ